MKRGLQLVAALAGAFALAGSLPSASLAYPSGTGFSPIVVDNGTGDQTEPHVSGNYAAYNIASTGANTIGFYTFSSNTRGSMPSAANFIDYLADINGSNVVFTRADTSNGASSIYEYSITGGTTAEVAPVAPSALPQRQNPAIGGSTIAWEDIGVSGSTSGNPEIVVDAAGTVKQLTNDAAINRNPNVSPDGSTVVWEKCGSPVSCASSDVYAAVKSGSSWTVSPIAATTANETWPDTNGSIVVYASDGSQVHYRPLSGGADQTIAMPAGWVRENHPSIAGDFISFEAFDGVQWDIWVYDLADNSLRQITNTTLSETLSDVSVATSGSTGTVTVVWQVTETDNNIYATRFDVAVQPALTDQFLQPLGQSTDPANPVINTGRNGKVIPVKVQLSQGTTAITDLNAPGPVTIAVSKLASCSTSAGSDPVTAYADAGQSSAGTNQFNYDSLAQAWVYNLDTKALGLITGYCYRIDVSVNGTQVANAFAVFQPTK